MRRGQIVWVDQSRAREPSKAVDPSKNFRPYLVVHNDNVQRLGGTFVCVPITGTVIRAKWRVFLSAGSCTPSLNGDVVPLKDSDVDCSHVHTFHNASVKSVWGKVPAPLMDDIDDALTVALDL